MNSLLRLEDMGYVFDGEGKDIVFDFKSGKLEDPKTINDLFEDVKNNKPTALIFLAERYAKKSHEAALKSGYLPYSINKCYGKQLTQNSEVFIQMLENDYWTSYRLTYRDGSEKASSEKTIAEGKGFLNILNRTERYIESFLNFIRQNE